MNENFWNKVDKTGTCWNWTGGTNGRPSGGIAYGLLKIPGTRKNITAHRMSFILHNGPITSDQWVLHKCDNPLCVNPEHLFLGDAAANVADMDAKGRRVVPDRAGEKNGRSVLDSEKVGAIRKLYGAVSVSQLAATFKIGKSQVYRVINGQQWA